MGYKGKEALLGIVFLALFFVSGCTGELEASEGAGDSNTSQSVRNVDFYGHQETAVYDRQEQVPSVIPSLDGNSVNMNERTIDVYRGQDDTEYSYFEGTSTLCGFVEKELYGKYLDIAEPITETQALAAANTMLCSLFGDYSEYERLYCEYSPVDAVYNISYSYPLAGIHTDNCIAVFVRSDGRVTGVNAYRYDYYRDTAITAESVQTAVSASNAAVQDGEITLRYIAVNDGELCLVTNYTGEDGLRQDVRRIE